MRKLPWLFAQKQRPARKPQPKISLEFLDERIVPAGIQPPHIVFAPAGPGETPYQFASIIGYTPQQLTHAYGMDQVEFGSVAGTGAGQTIAIVVAFDNPGFLDSTDPNFSTRPGHVRCGHRSAKPAEHSDRQSDGRGDAAGSADFDWADEIALDIEWSHSFAPKANLEVVEATDNSPDNLLQAVNYRIPSPGVSVVSMSFGGDEGPDDLNDDATYTTPAGHAGITFVAATGDDGAPGGFPAYAPSIVAVGGTELTLDSSGNVVSETGWSGSGGGISIQEPQPTFQNGVVFQSTTERTIPDISLNASPDTGAGVYDSFVNGASTPWDQIGGTSLATPCMAGILAVANQGRVLNGEAVLDGATQTLPLLYSAPAADFNDITVGNNGFQAGTGYDLVTGRGSPHGMQFVDTLVGITGTGGGGGSGGGSGTGTGTKTISGTAFVGADAGQPPLVRMINLATGAVESQFLAYNAAFTGGVRVARGDVNGDGIPDLIVAAGPGGGPHVKVFDGATLALIDSFYAYQANFTGGVYVAAADINGDGKADIITGAGAGGGPHVKVYSGADGSILTQFFAYAATFHGGVEVAGGDVNGDGKADIITGAGPGGSPHVKVFSGADDSVLDSFYAFDPSFRGGVFVAAGDLNGNGKDEIVAGSGPGGTPEVSTFDGTDGQQLLNFNASPVASSASQFSSDLLNTGGARVATVDAFDNGIADILILPGRGAAPDGQLRNGEDGSLIGSFDAFGASLLGGVFVG